MNKQEFEESKVVWMWDPKEARVEELALELGRIEAAASEVRTRRERAADLRYCRWEGQSLDGRKHADDLGVAREDVGPFEGAPDLKVRIADEIINEQVAVLGASVRRATIQAMPGDSGDSETAARASLLLRYLRDVKLADRLGDEVELSAQMLLGDDPGLAVIGVFWRQVDALEQVDYSVLDVAQLAVEQMGVPVRDPAAQQQVQQLVGEISKLLTSPGMEEMAEKLGAAVFPDMGRVELRRALKELREAGKGAFRTRYAAANEPVVVALRPWEDVFFDLETSDITRCSVVYVREVLTGIELAAKVESEGYDKAVAQEVLGKLAGKSFMVDGAGADPLSVREDDARRGVGEHDYELMHAYRWILNSDTWLPELWCTVFAMGHREAPLKHAPYRCPHAGGPFVAISRERLSRGLLESRGIPACVDSEQLEVKTQRDSRAAATMLATIPPMKKNFRRMGARLTLAPGAEIEVSKADDFEWLTPPPFPNGSVEVEGAILGAVNNYFGRDARGENPLAQLRLQAVAERFLAGWQQVFARVLAYAQAYMSPVDVAQVVGAMQPVVLTREQIRGAKDVRLKFDVADLNVQDLTQKLKVIYEFILRLDKDGTVDTVPIVKWAMGALDPHLAEVAVNDQQVAMRKEREAAKEALKDLMLGLEPDRGANFELRLQVVQEYLQTSQVFQQQFLQNELFRKGVQQHMEHLQSLHQQYRVNPAIGAQVRPG
jgi:hypothetical protein